eukprot:SAG31_NODE_1985_length_6715_cov_6.562924_7_plen_105_part_00
MSTAAALRRIGVLAAHVPGTDRVVRRGQNAAAAADPVAGVVPARPAPKIAKVVAQVLRLPNVEVDKGGANVQPVAKCSHTENSLTHRSWRDCAAVLCQTRAKIR